MQKELDVLANAILFTALREVPVAALVLEEIDIAVAAERRQAPCCVAIDPLDGSSNIDTNVSIGTIFSILPAPGDGSPCDAAAFFQPGEHQLAAGYVIYGPQTALALTTGAGTHIFTLDRRTHEFQPHRRGGARSAATREFAINASNHRHWDEPIRIYVDDCLKGCEGPRGEDFNMRWIASMVAEAHRVLARGGIYMYPGDLRNGYEHGRLRLIYEASPVAWLMEQAGAAASTGTVRILEITPAGAASARAADLRLPRRSRSPGPLSPRLLPRRRTLAAVRPTRPLPELMPMSTQHPIISVTGSSGAGTTSVRRTFEHIFRREKITAAFIEGDAFHRYDREHMRRVMADEAQQGNRHFSHFGPRANLLAELEESFAAYGRTGTCRTRHYIHDAQESPAVRLVSWNVYRLGDHRQRHGLALLRGPARLHGDR